MHTDLFRKMQRVRQLFFRCQSGHGSRMDWNHHGSGHTTITVEGNDIYFDDAFVLDNQRPCLDKKRWRFVEYGVEFHHFREQQYSKIFEFAVKVNDVVCGIGQGRSKKEAEQHAAQQALEKRK